MRSKKVKFILCLAALAILAGTSKTRAEPDAFLDELVTMSGSLDIGERTAFSPVGPPIPPTAAQSGPISAGLVRGQFDFTCGKGGTPADCPDAAYAASHLNWKWGALEVTDTSSFPPLIGSFVSVGGKTLFDSDLFPLTEGFSSVETVGFDGNPFTRLAHFEFTLEGAGVVLQPGNSYVLFAVLSEFAIPDNVPGAGPGFTGIAEESIYQSAVVDGPPFQFHQAFPVFDPTGNLNQLATSRLIPIVPEPTTGVLSLLGGLSLMHKYRRRKPL